jgi:hypothetical protein
MVFERGDKKRTADIKKVENLIRCKCPELKT